MSDQIDYQEYFEINGENYSINVINKSIIQLKITKKKLIKSIISEQNICNNIFHLELKFLKNGLMNLQIGFSMNIKKLHINYEKKNIKLNNISNLQISSVINNILNINIPETVSFGEIYLRIIDFDVNNIEKKIFRIFNRIFDSNEKKKICIIQNNIINSIGEYFKIIFKNKNYDCITKNKLTIEDCMDSINCNILYIIIYLNENHYLLPHAIIFYQIEQSNSIFLSDKKNLKKIRYIIQKSEQVWEYSSITTHIYSKYCINKLKWIPMPYVFLDLLGPNNIDNLDNFEIFDNCNNFDNCEYDLFFFGHKNIRRIKILEELAKYFPKLKIGFECYNIEKINFIVKSKIILNLHYYKEAGLETCRINEILNYNKLIISEKSELDTNNMELYDNLVIFVDEIDCEMKNIKNLIKTIKFYLIKSNYINFMDGFSTKLIDLEKKIQDKIIL